MNLLSKYKRLRSNKDARALTENFIALSLLKVAGYVFPLITLPYLARVIGVESFGELAFAASIIVYFETLTEFGFNYTATRDVAQNRDDLVFVSRVFSQVMVSKVVLMILSFGLLLIGIYTIPYLYNMRWLLFATFCYVPGHILFPEWFFQAMEKMKYITVMNLCSKLVFTVLVFVVIRKQSDYLYQPILIALGFLVSGIISLWVVYRKFGVRFIVPTPREIKGIIRKNWNMFLSLFLPNFYTNFSVILLKTYGGAAATGIYSSGSRFITLFEQISLMLSRTFYPFLARRIDKHNLYVKISGTISIAACLFLFFGADLLIKIFLTPEFAEAARVIRVMSLAPFFLFLMNTYGTNYLVLIGQEKVLKNIILWCSIGGFILSWLIVTRYSYLGISITIIAVWGIRGIVTWFYANRFKNRLKNG